MSSRDLTVDDMRQVAKAKLKHKSRGITDTTAATSAGLTQLLTAEHELPLPNLQDTTPAELQNDTSLSSRTAAIKYGTALQLQADQSVQHWCSHCGKMTKFRLTSTKRSTQITGNLHSQTGITFASVSKLVCTVCGEEAELNPAEFANLQAISAPAQHAQRVHNDVLREGASQEPLPESAKN